MKPQTEFEVRHGRHAAAVTECRDLQKTILSFRADQGVLGAQDFFNLKGLHEEYDRLTAKCTYLASVVYA